MQTQLSFESRECTSCTGELIYFEHQELQLRITDQYYLSRYNHLSFLLVITYRGWKSTLAELYPMALGEGVEQLEEGFSDVDSSDSENEDILKAFEPVVPRSGKRTYGVLVDDMMSERRHKNAKLDEQLAFLRSILPGTHEREEGASVLLDAFEHITRLQKSVDDLRTELVPLCNPATLSAAYLKEESLEEASAAQSTSAGSICVLYHHPMVVVKREEGKMEVHIACINRPGLLVDIVGALDSKRITVLHARIACRQNVLFEALTLEKDTLVLHAGPEPLPKEAEDEAVKDIIVRAIRQESSGNSPQ